MIYREYYIQEASKTLTASATGTSLETHTLKIDRDSDFEIVRTTYAATNDRIKVKMRDDVLGLYLLKDAADIKAIAGRNTLDIGLSNSFLPFNWPQPHHIVRAGATLTLEMADYSNVSNAVRLALHGSKIKQGQPPWAEWVTNPKRMRPMIYSFSGGAKTVTANGTATALIEADIDSHFLVQKITGIRTGGATISVNEGASGREWSNQAMHLDNLVGNGSFPNILPAYRFITKGSTLTINLTDLSGASNVIDVVLIGVKLLCQ